MKSRKDRESKSFENRLKIAKDIQSILFRFHDIFLSLVCSLLRTLCRFTEDFMVLTYFILSEACSLLQSFLCEPGFSLSPVTDYQE